MASDEIGSSTTGEAEFLSHFQPSENALFNWLRKRVDNSMLQEIAEADYGMDADDHFKVLVKVRDGEKLPVPLTWVPKEVLELIRWSQPQDPSWKPGSIGTRGHLMRAFACTLLLQASVEPENANYLGGENQTIIQLVDSAIALSDEAAEAALRFLCWCFPRVSETNEEKPFYAMAILLLQVFLSKHDRDGKDLLVSCNWVINEEARVRTNLAGFYPANYGGWWLLGLTWYNQRHETWKALTHKLLLEPAKPHPAKVADTLQLIGMALLGEV